MCQTLRVWHSKTNLARLPFIAGFYSQFPRQAQADL